jgi:hypothetical protein
MAGTAFRILWIVGLIRVTGTAGLAFTEIGDHFFVGLLHSRVIILLMTALACGSDVHLQHIGSEYAMATMTVHAVGHGPICLGQEMAWVVGLDGDVAGAATLRCGRRQIVSGLDDIRPLGLVMGILIVGYGVAIRAVDGVRHTALGPVDGLGQQSQIHPYSQTFSRG